MSYMEQYATLEVPAVLPPERSQQATAEVAQSGMEAHAGDSAPQFGQSLQLVSSYLEWQLQLLEIRGLQVFTVRVNAYLRWDAVQAKDLELRMLHRKMTALAKSEAG